MKGFTKLPNWLFEDPRVDASAIGLIAAILKHGNPSGGNCYPGIPKLAKLCQRQPKWVRAKLHRLEKDGVLKPTARPGRTNVYKLVKPLPKKGRGSPPEKREAINNQSSSDTRPKVSPITGLKQDRTPLMLGILPPNFLD